jgi:nucleotide-binding universal stress UspA family protein
MFRTILCPIDFSAHSRQALRYAALLASRSRGRLIVLYVEDPLLMNAAAAANYQAKELIASMRKDLARVVRRTIAPYGINTDLLTLEVGVGKPHAKIRSTAEKFGSDLVVMGSHGLTGPGRLMFGSTTHRVLRSVEVPVLAIPPVKSGTAVPSRSWPGRWVMAPVDLGAKDKRDALNAALVTDALGSQLLLLHVVETGDQSVWQRLDLPRSNRERLMKTRAEARLGALRDRTEAAVVTATRVVAGRPAAQIAAAAADRQVGLVIMTRRRGRGLFGPRQGSISYQVLCNAKTPVLALPSNNKWIKRTASRSLKAKRSAA